MSDVPSPGLFTAGSLRAVTLVEADLPELQRFFEANPLYFETVNGAPARPDEAAREFHDRPPASMPCGAVRMLGLRDEAGELVAMASVLENLLAPAVWHIGLFIVATRLHGSGAAAAFHRGLQAWAMSRGARWMRLGVVCGNTPAERFWQKAGYVELRQRDGARIGDLTQRLSVRVKPLAEGDADAEIAEYLRRVDRDRPEAD